MAPDRTCIVPVCPAISIEIVFAFNGSSVSINKVIILPDIAISLESGLSEYISFQIGVAGVLSAVTDDPSVVASTPLCALPKRSVMFIRNEIRVFVVLSTTVEKL